MSIWHDIPIQETILASPGRHQPAVCCRVATPLPDLPLHRHDFTEIIIGLRGQARHITWGHCRPVTVGSVQVVPPQMPHSLRCQTGYQHLLVMVDVPRLLPRPTSLQRAPAWQQLFARDCRVASGWRLERVVVLGARDLTTVLAVAEEIVAEERQRGPGWSEVCQAGGIRLLTHLARHGRCGSQPVPADAIDGLRARILERWHEPWSLDRLAREARCSVSSLQRAFRRRWQSSPQRLLEVRRLEEAAALLDAGSAPIATIAGRCGFADANYFTRRFSRRYGCSPGAWRRRLALLDAT